MTEAARARRPGDPGAERQWPAPPPPGVPPVGAGAPMACAPDPAFVAEPTVTVTDVSMWFGQKVALSELHCSFGAGVTGLLGPNGAGKTTLMRAVTGLVEARTGRVRVLGQDPRTSRAVQRSLALVPEEEVVPGALTARQFVRYVADLHGVADRAAPDRELERVDLLGVADRDLDGFSKGMRQRTKVAGALVTNPQVLVLDEPLNGADPVQRTALISLFRSLGAQGRTVLVSSHVLSEVERLADRVVVLVQGRFAAAGGQRAIRDAMADRPRRVGGRSAGPRRLAAALLGVDAITGVSVEGDALVVSTLRARELALALPQLARHHRTRLHEVRPLDDSLDALFRELVR